MTENSKNDDLWLAELLDDPSVWAEPREGLEDAVVAAVATAEAGAPATREARAVRARRSRAARWPRLLLGVAAAALVVVAAGAIVARPAPGPDFEGELAATDLAPGARASVDVTRNDGGFRVILDADGLEPLGAGEHYQAWLKDEAGDLVAIGTFSSSDERITLWSGESPERFPVLSVTIEAADGDPASSGRVVLAGELHSEE